MKKENGKLHYGFIIVISVFLQMFLAGALLQTSGLFVVPVTSALGISQGTYMMYMTIQYIVMAIAAMFVPKLLAKYAYTILNRIGIVIMGLGIIAMAFAKNIVPVYFGGICLGCGMVVVTFLASGTLIPRWFKTRVGIMLATAGLGLSISGVIMSPVVSRMLSQSSILGMESWRGTYVVLAAAFLVIGLVNAIFVMKDEPGPGQKRYGEDEIVTEKEVSGKNVVGVEKQKAVKSASFVWFVIMIISWNVTCQINVYLSAYASFSAALEKAGFDLVGIIASVSMIGAIVGSYIIGGANDKFGAKGGAVVAGIFGVAGCILMLIGNSSAAVMLVGAAFFGIYYAINGIQMPAMVTTMYGEKDYAAIYPFAAAFAPWFGAISSSLWGFLYDLTGTYTSMLVIGAVLCAVTGVSGILAVNASKKLR